MLPAPRATSPATRVAAGLTGVALAAAWPFVEPQLPVLRHEQVPVLPPGAPPLRVLHVSDLHLLPRHRRRAAWVRGLARLHPDLVVSTGDHVSSPDAAELLAETLGALTADGAVGAFVPGNNDYYLPVPPSPLAYLLGRPPVRRAPDLPWADVAAALTGAGWTDLTHRRTAHELRGSWVVLTGTDDAHLRRDRYAQVGGPLGEDVLGIGVTHTPARRLLEAFASDGHSLVLAGHTHGGQLRLPGAGAVVTNCDLPRRRARGLTRDDRGWLHVSAGLGTSPWLPVRLCCRPEATLLELVPTSGRDGRSAGPVR
ncbi:MAG TPA: metallophosphoesterase [Mycobacteriales bacterium]|nr:metallophosphoesterase [Mycobacteriales bacterium]